MSDKVEGTIVLDGLIEGQLPHDDPEIEQRLRQWVEFVGEMGLRFSLDVTGNAFSILPDNTAASCEKLGPDPTHVIRQALEQMLSVIPAGANDNVFSTLRSAEYRRGEEVQALYAVASDRSIQIEKRIVDAKTTRPPQPLTRREKLRLGAFGLLIAVAIVGVTSLFVDVRGLWSQVVETVRPINAEEIEVDASAFETYLTVGEKRALSNPTRIVVTLERSSAYPATEEQLQLAYEQSGESLTGRLAVEALARGYVRCELFGAEERYLGSATIRISDLRKKEKIDLGVPLPKKTRVERIVITY